METPVRLRVSDDQRHRFQSGSCLVCGAQNGQSRPVCAVRRALVLDAEGIPVAAFYGSRCDALARAQAFAHAAAESVDEEGGAGERRRAPRRRRTDRELDVFHTLRRVIAEAGA